MLLIIEFSQEESSRRQNKVIIFTTVALDITVSSRYESSANTHYFTFVFNGKTFHKPSIFAFCLHLRLIYKINKYNILPIAVAI